MRIVHTNKNYLIVSANSLLILLWPVSLHVFPIERASITEHVIESLLTTGAMAVPGIAVGVGILMLREGKPKDGLWLALLASSLICSIVLTASVRMVGISGS